jgi:paraquat-inducible protein A
MSMAIPLAGAVACPDCDLLQRIPHLEPGAKARCARCGHVLASQSADPLDRPLALTLAALVAFILANTTSLMDLSAVGRFASTTMLSTL